MTEEFTSLDGKKPRGFRGFHLVRKVFDRVGRGAGALTRKLAGTVFLVRVASAGLAYVSQVLLARWMGTSDYGVYVYAWTWVLLLGSMLDFGMGISSQRFIPEYREANDVGRLRGFLLGSRLLAVLMALVIGAILALVVRTFSPSIGEVNVVPLYIGCIILPAYVLGTTQDGIARSHDWMLLGLMPQFVIRQVLILALIAVALGIGMHLDAAVAMLASCAAVLIATVGQTLVLDSRLRALVPSATRIFEVRRWITASLPILMVEGFYLLLSYMDILILERFRSSADVAVYFAVVKTLAIVSFAYYAMAASTAHRFAEYHVTGDHVRLSEYVTHAAKWTFWPSLGVTIVLLAAGKPLLGLFGDGFADGYPIMFVAAIGLIVRSSVGPVGRLLTMSGNQNLCAAAYGTAFAVNLVLCLIFVPRYGVYGAAGATSFSLAVETVLLFLAARRRLGLHPFIFGRAPDAPARQPPAHI